MVRSFGNPPRYEPFDLPPPSGGGQALVDVLAVGLHPRVRSGASGSHYTSTGKLPMVPGIDGVGRREDGQMVYFIADDELAGPMATRTVIDTRRAMVLPDGADVVKIAAAMNPAMSAWVALRRRVPIEAGQSVLVLGATGNAGQMAIQVAKRLGAGRVLPSCRHSSTRSTTAASRSPPARCLSPTSRPCGPRPRSRACAPSCCPDPGPLGVWVARHVAQGLRCDRGDPGTLPGGIL